MTFAEAVLPDAVRAQFPSTTPGPPWEVRCAITTWVHRANREAAGVLPEQLRDRKRVGITTWMLVHYFDTPVGPYDEIACVPVALRGPSAVHIPFIAVDSIPSVHAGRTHWNLPKVLANFTSHDGGSTAVTADESNTMGWAIDVHAKKFGPQIPIRGSSSVQQVDEAGALHTYPQSLRGRGHVARVQVEADIGDGLRQLLKTGTHWGFVIPDASLRVGTG